MGMYTEFYFRANVKDGPVVDWLDSYVNGENDQPFDDSEFFQDDYWIMVFWGGGAVYQESRSPIFRRKGDGQYYNQLVLASSMKHSIFIDQFIGWITPHLDMPKGEFLGYSLYEDTGPSGWGTDTGPNREHPHLYFAGMEEVRA